VVETEKHLFLEKRIITLSSVAHIKGSPFLFLCGVMHVKSIRDRMGHRWRAPCFFVRCGESVKSIRDRMSY
jgi:hypothetical protein